MFSDIIGHDDIKERLVSLIGNPSGTYLFHGPPSSGKRTVAFETAKAILCEKKIGDNCTCKSCKRFNRGHPDFLCIGQHDKIKVADVDQVIDFTFLSPLLSDRKVIVIDNADDITWEAANRLLKILEEPPVFFSFFLITSNPQALIPTILYRCFKYEFNSMSKKDMAMVITKKLGFEPDQAKVLSNIAVDSSVDVFSKAGQLIKYRDMAVEFILAFKQRDLIDQLDFVDKIERSDMAVFSDMVLLVLTDLLLLSNGIHEIGNVDIIKKLTKISELFNKKALIGVTSAFSQVKRNLNLNVNIAFVFKTTLIRIHSLAIVGV
jgi:DNA polymerase-3 subunit delta'